MSFKRAALGPLWKVVYVNMAQARKMGEPRAGYGARLSWAGTDGRICMSWLSPCLRATSGEAEQDGAKSNYRKG